MAASFLPSAGAPRPRRPPRSSGARRAQDARAQARCVQRLLGGFDALGHRGCRPSRLGAALASALALGGDDGFRHPTPSAPPLPPAGAGGVVPGLVRGASPLQAALSRMFVALPLPQAAEALARVFAAAEAATDGLPGWHAAIDLVTDLFDLLTNTAHLTEADNREAQLAAERNAMAAADRVSDALATAGRESRSAATAMAAAELEAAAQAALGAADLTPCERRAATADLAAAAAADLAYSERRAAFERATADRESALTAGQAYGVVIAVVRIAVREAFDSADDPPVVIAAGTNGVVMMIDADGDALIVCHESGNCHVWVYSTDFGKLDVLEAG